MPVTPLHMGPGLAVKAVAGRHFSLMVFGFTQVTIDIEPLVRIIREDPVLDGFTHTYLGATAIAVLSGLIGRPVCQFLLSRWNHDPYSSFMNWLRGPRNISWTAAISGAAVGAYSHVLFDSIMHFDMRPLAPHSEVNALFHLISVDGLHLLCLIAGAIGATLMSVLFLLQRRSVDNQANPAIIRDTLRASLRVLARARHRER